MSRGDTDSIKSMMASFGGAKADYSAMKSSRFRRSRGTSGVGTTADYHLSDETRYLKLIEDARAMDRDDTVVGQIVDRAVDNMIQGGFRCDPKPGDEEVGKMLQDKWDTWSCEPDLCDSQRESAFSDMEWSVLRACIVDGDILGLAMGQRNGIGAPYGSIQQVEAHRLQTPQNATRKGSRWRRPGSEVVHGVQIDSARKRVEYWVTQDEINPSRRTVKISDVKRYRTRDEDGMRQVFHPHLCKRISQTRGVTAFAPIFDLLGMCEDINFAKLVQQQIVSCFAIFKERTEEWPGGDDPATGETSTERVDSTYDRQLEGIAPGMVVRGKPGEKLIGFSPNVPNETYFEHYRQMLTLIGVNLGLPLVMVLMDASGTNFSGWRGAVDQARIGFRRNQQRLIRRWHRPIYRWQVRRWLMQDDKLYRAANNAGLLGDMKRIFDWPVFRCDWKTPSWQYIEPLKDAKADDLLATQCLASRRRIASDRAISWEDESTDIVADNLMLIKKAKEAAAKLNEEYEDEPISWRDLLNPLKGVAPVSELDPEGQDRVMGDED